MWSPTDILSIESWILIGSLLALGRYYLHRKWSYLSKLGVPGDPPSILAFGHLKRIFHKHDSFHYDLRMKKKYGPIWGFYFGTSPNIMVHDIEILRKIFIKEFSTFPIRQKNFTKISGKEMNSSLTSVEDHQWKRIRTTMTPTFSTAKLKQMASLIEWCADNTKAVFVRKNDNVDGTFNSKDVFSRLSLDIVCSAAFSTRVHSQDDTKEEPAIAKNAKKIFSGSVLYPLALLIVLFPKLEHVMDKYDITLFDRKAIDYFKTLSKHVKGLREKQTQDRVDLMQLMLDAEIPEKEAKSNPQKGMTETEIIGNSMLMILAGYENTGNTMNFLAYNLAMYPDVQVEVQKEIDQMMETHGKFDYDGLSQLKFLDQCINETLRLYNPILRNGRCAVKDISLNGLNIPKGMMVNVPVFALSHDPEYWDDPWEFKPERMKDPSAIDPMIFQPFGAGPRNCIGMRFALMEVKLSMSKLLHSYTFKPAANTPKPPLKLEFKVSVRSEIDYDLRAVPRKTEE